jgi:hypothetical protein
MIAEAPLKTSSIAIGLLLWVGIACQSRKEINIDTNSSAHQELSPSFSITAVKDTTRGFFKLMGRITEYECRCQDKTVEAEKVYLLLTESGIGDPKGYSFKLMLDSMDTANADRIFWQGDTLVFDLSGYLKRISQQLQSRGKTLTYSTKETRSPFLIFSKVNLPEWQAKTTLFTGKVSRAMKPLQGRLFYGFQVNEDSLQAMIPTHSSYVHQLYANKEHGIVYLAYFDGYSQFDCWLHKAL